MIACAVSLITRFEDSLAVQCTAHGLIGHVPRASHMNETRQRDAVADVLARHIKAVFVQAGGDVDAFEALADLIARFPGVADPVVLHCLALDEEIQQLRAEADRKYKVLLDKLCDDLTAEQKAEYRRVLYGGST